jgi:hypothetical protein
MIVVVFDGMLDRNVPIPTYRCEAFPLSRSNGRRSNSLRRPASSRQEN